MTSTIKIAVVGGDVPPGQSNIRFSSVQGKKEAVVRVPLPNAFISEEIRWYLEDFAQHHPFERERAKDAETALIDHGKDLAFYIHCSKVLESSQPTKRHTLIVEVDDSAEMPPSMLWEALERKGALNSFGNVESAIVTRVFTNGPLGHGLRDIAIVDCNGEPNPLTVLIVSARADFEKDIPHRLVSQEALKSLDALSHRFPMAKDLTRVEVIHPATFKAFQSHLEGQKPGYFSLVHLDLHGVEDASGDVKLDFIKGEHNASGEFRCIRDPRSAEQVGQLLERHQVGRVVLNACRSTHQSGPGGTFPRVLRRHGVHEIVAMSYQVSSRCVQYFTSWFYATLFATRVLPAAVWCGRKSIERSTERLSRFGMKLHIMDHIMPVCYQSQEWLQREEKGKIASIISNLAIDNDNPEDDPALALGREHDLLRLECMLLEGGRPVIVVAEPGIGKSVLIAVLAQWWSSTGCAAAIHTSQLSQDKAFTVDKMCRDIHQTFKCPGPYNGRQGIVSFLRATRFLVIIDSLESMTVEGSTTSGRQRVALKDFIKALRGGKTVLLLSSRQEDSILSPYTSTFPLSGLTTIPAIHLMRGLLKLSRKSVTDLPSMDSATLHARISSTMGIDMASEDSSYLSEYIEALKQESKSGLESLYATWDTEEDGIFLEEIHKLVNGHPLALVLLSINMAILGPEMTPKRFMHALLQGAPVILNRKALIQENGEEMEGMRSLDDLDRMISDLRTEMPFAFKDVVGLLATFWKVIPTRGLHLFQRFQTKEYAVSGDKNAEVIALVNTLESAGLCKDMTPNLKKSFMRIGTGTLDALKEKQVELDFYDYLDAEGLLERVPEIKALTRPMREMLSQLPNLNPVGIEMHEALSSHESTFIFTWIRDNLLEKSEGLDEDAQGTIRSLDSLADALAMVAPDSPAAGLHHLVTSAQSSFVQHGLKALMDSRLLEIPRSDEAAETKAGMQYIKTSPLLTIILRGQFCWSEDKPFVASHKVALALFYAHRCQSWPPLFPVTRTPAWNAAKSEAEVEFYNLASAAAICKDQLRDKNRGFIVEEVMMDTVLRLAWCSMTDKISAPIVQMLWEQSLDEAQQTVQSIESSGNRPRKKNWLGSILSPPAEKDVPLLQRQTELRLFSRRTASVVLALGLLRFYNHFDDKRTRRCNDIIKVTARNIKKDSYPLEMIQQIHASRAWIIDLGTSVAESSLSNWILRRKKTVQDLQELAEKQWPSTLAANADKKNTTNLPNPDAYGQLDPQTYAAVAMQFYENMQEVHQLVGSGNYDAARELLNAAIEEELEHGLNDPGRRSTLLFFSSVVSAKQGRLSDALRDLDEYRRLSSIAGPNSGWISMGTITSFMRRSLAWILKMESRSEVLQNTRLEPCAGCYKKRGTRRCLGCFYTLYCSRECQKGHWVEHKKVCKKLGSGYSI